MRIIDGLDELTAAVGADLGATDWVDVDQSSIDRFCDAAGDATFFAVALTNGLMPQLLDVRGVAMGVNYGTNRIALGAPVTAGSRVRAAAVIAACEQVKGGVQATVRITVEVDGRDEPACVVEALSRYVA
ncbi:MAG: putative enoyl-CoA hydratase 1 [Acidimicrobiales bacterium]|nr:putative enoyl-CoA hydratase 1 [Acidimicrobiales bacterium]